MLDKPILCEETVMRSKPETVDCLKSEHIKTVSDLCQITPEQIDGTCKIGDRNEIKNMQKTLCKDDELQIGMAFSSFTCKM